MHVAIIFDESFSGNAANAVWIIDTPANHRWLDEQEDLDPNSSIFPVERYPSLEEAGLYMIWNAQDHHPSWREIEVIGLPLTPLHRDKLAPNGKVVPTETGFKLLKR